MAWHSPVQATCRRPGTDGRSAGRDSNAEAKLPLRLLLHTLLHQSAEGPPTLGNRSGTADLPAELAAGVAGGMDIHVGLSADDGLEGIGHRADPELRRGHEILFIKLGFELIPVAATGGDHEEHGPVRSRRSEMDVDAADISHVA